MPASSALNTLRARLAPYTWTAFRVAVGVIMALFGLDKLQHVDQWDGFLAAKSVPVPELSVWLAIAGELLGGLGLIAGLLTPIAATGVFFTMLVALLSFHLPDGFQFKDDWGPLVMLFAALHIFTKGGGRLSLDALLAKRRDTATAPALNGA